MKAHDNRSRRSPTKAITVRVPAARLAKVMRARRARTQSALINALLAEAEEGAATEALLRATAGSACDGDIDDRLL